MGQTGQCFTELDEAWPAGAGVDSLNLWLNCPFKTFIIIVMNLGFLISRSKRSAGGVTQRR